MSEQSQPRLYLPALRGRMGDWEYYTCLVPLKEVASRVDFAEELHPKTGRLSDLLQRSLKQGRGKQIADYLANEKERLFNSLVVAVYGGDPEWHEFGSLKPQRPDIKLEDISATARDSVGFLSLDGRERLFALDGQHRLAGIKIFADSGGDDDPDDIAVMFVAHKNSIGGLQRTRRLFTTLNKRAKAVSKGEIISLDEDDAMAICVRRLVEDCDYFTGERIAYTSNTNIPTGNRKCLTTIGNLYDILKLLFTRVESDHKSKPSELLYYRPDDDTIERLCEFAIEFFTLMAAHFKPLGEFFRETKFEQITAKYRGDFGGNFLFRPIGLTTITHVIAELTKDYTLEDAIKYASWLPLNLADHPLVDLVWDSNREAMKKPQNEVLTRKMFLYMLGYQVDEDAIARAYAVAIGDPGMSRRFFAEVAKVVAE